MSKGVLAEDYKKRGNQEFQNKNYTRAISLYELAVALDSSNSIYFFNLAESYSKLNMWKKAMRYSTRALELKNNYVKALALNGRSMVELGKYSPTLKDIDEGIKSLEKARLLCSGQNKKTFEEEIARYLKNAKKIRWLKNHEIITLEGEVLCDHLANLVKQEYTNEEEQRKQIELIREKLIPKKPKCSDIPKYLLCKLTGEIMNDPVITSEGYTYERDKLFKYFEQNEKKDPITKKEIDINKIYANITIKTVTNEYLEKEPWAFRSKGDIEDYRIIKC